MGLPLILAASASIGTLIYKILLVLIGVNLLILVHEWGHFIVARMCGVKCEKFYVWFDIFGWKLFKFRWGDTEYGLGVLPLGGYVKMLGQEDNPARLREELEKAKAREADPEGAVSEDDSEPGELVDIAAAEAALFAPDSYLSKSVPQRMAIISAGVIMNVIFAFVVAVMAYQIGVREKNCAIGAVGPGRAAWQNGLQVGDRIEQINGKEARYFEELLRTMQTGDIEGGVPLVIRRPGVDAPIEVNIVPDRDWLIPAIGIGSPSTTVLRTDTQEEESPVAFPGSPAGEVASALQAGDRIVQVGDEPIDIYRDFLRQEALQPETPLTVTVERPAQTDSESPGDPSVEPERITVEVAPRPMRWFGLVMEMGPVTAIRVDSEAAAAGIKPGDRITAINGQPIDNPMTLPQTVRRLAADQTEITLTIKPAGEETTVEKTMALTQPESYLAPIRGTEPVALPPLGLAYEVLNRVAQVVPGTPAAKGGLKSGDVIEGVRVVMPDKESLEKFKELGYRTKAGKDVLSLDGEDAKLSWPGVMDQMQSNLPGSKLELTLSDEKEVVLEPVAATDWFNPNRGFSFESEDTIVKAESFGEAVKLGWQKAYESLTMVFQFLGKVGTQVSPKAMGGPVTIVKVAYSAADDFSRLLVFLCMISANLAVINILPIPVLDGGHMVFLTYEGIRRKPPSEAVFVGLSYVGLLFILGLMVFVLGLDFGLISR